jgi:putative oxidoreductase
VAKGLWVQNDGYEYPLVLVVVAATLALTGRWSADHALGVTPWPVRVCAAALVLGPVSGLLSRVVLHRPTAPEGTHRYAQAAD